MKPIACHRPATARAASPATASREATAPPSPRVRVTLGVGAWDGLPGRVEGAGVPNEQTTVDRRRASVPADFAVRRCASVVDGAAAPSAEQAAGDAPYGASAKRIRPRAASTGAESSPAARAHWNAGVIERRANGALQAALRGLDAVRGRLEQVAGHQDFASAAVLVRALGQDEVRDPLDDRAFSPRDAAVKQLAGCLLRLDSAERALASADFAAAACDLEACRRPALAAHLGDMADATNDVGARRLLLLLKTLVSHDELLANFPRDLLPIVVAHEIAAPSWRCAIDDSGTLVAPNGAALRLPAPASMSDRDARAWYLEHEQRIPGLVDAGKSVDERARQAFVLRSAFRIHARTLMKDRDFARDLDDTNPHRTWMEIIAKYALAHPPDRMWAEIIDASQRSREAVKLALELPFFNDWPDTRGKPDLAR